MATDIVITPDRSPTGVPRISFVGASGSGISLQVLSDGSVAYMGTQGYLFGIVDSLTGSLMSVTDVSSLPIMEVFSDDRVVMGSFSPGRDAVVVSGRRLGIGTASPLFALDVTGNVRLGGSGAAVTFGSGIILGASTTSGGGVAFFDSYLYRVGQGSWAFDSASATTSVQLRQNGNNNGYLQTVGGAVTLGTNGAASLTLAANNVTVATFSPTTLYTTLASGLILGNSNVTGGGINWPDISVSRTAAGTLLLQSPATVSAVLNIGINGQTNGYLAQAAAAGAICSTSATNDIVLRSQTNLWIATNGQTASAVFDATQRASFMSGLFFADTGNFTLSGAASVSQLKQISGALNASIAAGSAGVTSLNGLSGTLSLVGTGGNLFISTGAPGQVIISGSGIATITNLLLTGQTLYSNDLNLSGSLTQTGVQLANTAAATYATLTNVTSTGVQLAATAAATYATLTNVTTSGTLLSAIKVTGSAIQNVANFTGANGTSVFLSGGYIVITGGGAGGGGVTQGQLDALSGVSVLTLATAQSVLGTKTFGAETHFTLGTYADPLNGISAGVKIGGGNVSLAAYAPAYFVSGAAFGQNVPTAFVHIGSGLLRADGDTFLAVTGGNVGVGTSVPRVTLDVSGLSRSRSYQIEQTGTTVQATGALSGQYNVDFAGAGWATVTISGATVISGRNYTAGSSITARVYTVGSGCSLTFPNWAFLTAPAPTGLASGKVGVLTVTSWSTVDSGCIAAWAQQP